MSLRLRSALLLLVIGAFPASSRGGYLDASVDMIQRPNNVLHSAGYAAYYTFLGNLQWTETLIGDHSIDSIADRPIHAAGQYDNWVEGTGASGQCYRGALSIAAYDTSGSQDASNAYGTAEQCIDPPPSGGGGDPDQQCPAPCTTGGYSPIVISLENNVDDAIDSFPLSGPKDPVAFDITGDGRLVQISWTKKNSKVGFLALDRDGNGSITSGAELFGNFTPMPDGQLALPNSNGYIALRGYDLPQFGGNSDGHIGPEDSIWPFLRIWIDSNHDGVSQPDEIYTLEEVGIMELGRTYVVTDMRDKYGNLFRFKGTATVVNSFGDRQLAPTYDVFFQPVN